MKPGDFGGLRAAGHWPPRATWAQTPLAERLAAYADRLRFEDIDAATIEQVRSFVIDTIGCGIAAFGVHCAAADRGGSRSDGLAHR